MTEPTAPFDQDLYDRVLEDCGYKHDYECNAPATMFSLGIESAADSAARIAAERAATRQSLTDEAYLALKKSIYAGIKRADLSAGDERAVLMEVLESLRSALAGAVVPQIPAGWWLDTVFRPSGEDGYEARLCNGKFSVRGNDPNDPWDALRAAIAAVETEKK